MGFGKNPNIRWHTESGKEISENNDFVGWVNNILYFL